MKTLITLSLLTIITFSYGQETTLKEGGNYFINPSIEWESINKIKEGSIEQSEISDALVGNQYKLKIQNITGDKVYFKFWTFSNDTTLYKIYNGEKGNKVFNIPVSDFRNLTKPYYNLVEWRVGVFTVPFKLRLDDFNFTANVNLGTSLSAKFRTNRKKEEPFMLEPLVSIGIAGVAIDEDNADITPNTPTNLFAFSLTGGLLLHINKKVDVGFFLGMDKLSNSDQNKVNWKHNGNLWIGTGFNVKFSDKSENIGSDGTNN